MWPFNKHTTSKYQAVNLKYITEPTCNTAINHADFCIPTCKIEIPNNYNYSKLTSTPVVNNYNDDNFTTGIVSGVVAESFMSDINNTQTSDIVQGDGGSFGGGGSDASWSDSSSSSTDNSTSYDSSSSFDSSSSSSSDF